MRWRLIGSVVAAVAALAVAGCGSSGKELPSAGAESLLSGLDTLETQVNASDCAGASATLTSLYETTSGLPPNTKGELISGLRKLLNNLDNMITTDCGPSTTTTSSTTETTTTETTTEPTTTTTEPTTEPTTTTTGDATGGTPPSPGGGG